MKNLLKIIVVAVGTVLVLGLSFAAISLVDGTSSVYIQYEEYVIRVYDKGFYNEIYYDRDYQTFECTGPKTIIMPENIMSRSPKSSDILIEISAEMLCIKDQEWFDNFLKTLQ